MKIKNSILGLMLLLMIEQTSFAIYNGYNMSSQDEDTRSEQEIMQEKYMIRKNDNEVAGQAAVRLIEEALYSPQMQQAIFELYNRPFVINKHTGDPVMLDEENNPIDWPTIDDMLQRIEITSTVGQKGLRPEHVKALQTLQQAIVIASKVAELEVVYAPQQASYWFWQSAQSDILQALTNYQTKINNLLQLPKVNVRTPLNQTVSEAIIAKLNQQDLFVLSPSQVANVLKNNDWVALSQDTSSGSKIDQAAQLLIKELYISQLHHRKDASFFDDQNKDVKIPSDAFNNSDNLNYIYKNFASLKKLIIHAKRIRYSDVKHARLCDLRVAVQTALSIAYNQHVRFYHLTNHPLVYKLQELDKEVLEAWKITAQPAEIARDTRWESAKSYMKIAAGIGIGLAVLGAATYAYFNPENAKRMTTNYIVDPLYDAGTAVVQLPGKIGNNLLYQGQRALGINKLTEDTAESLETTKENLTKQVKQLENTVKTKEEESEQAAKNAKKANKLKDIHSAIENDYQAKTSKQAAENAIRQRNNKYKELQLTEKKAELAKVSKEGARNIYIDKLSILNKKEYADVLKQEIKQIEMTDAAKLYENSNKWIPDFNITMPSMPESSNFNNNIPVL